MSGDAAVGCWDPPQSALPADKQAPLCGLVAGEGAVPRAVARHRLLACCSRRKKFPVRFALQRLLRRPRAAQERRSGAGQVSLGVSRLIAWSPSKVDEADLIEQDCLVPLLLGAPGGLLPEMQYQPANRPQSLPEFAYYIFMLTSTTASLGPSFQLQLFLQSILDAHLLLTLGGGGPAAAAATCCSAHSPC